MRIWKFWKFVAVLLGVLCLFLAFITLLGGRENSDRQPGSSHAEFEERRKALNTSSDSSREGSLVGKDIKKDNSNASQSAIDQERSREVIYSLIGDEQTPGRSNYKVVLQTLDESYLPALREMLADEQLKQHWRRIAPMIAWLSSNRDPESLRSILEYAQRQESAVSGSNFDQDSFLFGKASVLRYMGKFELPEAINFLRNAFSVDGSRLLVRKWSDASEPLDNTSASLFAVDVRGYAARGLISSGKIENFELVKDEYEAFVHSSQQPGSSTGDYTLGSSEYLLWYDYLLEAMAESDIIEDKGLETLLSVIGTDRLLDFVEPYHERYRGTVGEDNSVVIDPCPICGQTRE
jgi:hypothetical protein